MTKKMQHFSLKVLTINIHKGFTAFNRLVRAHHFLQADNVRADGANRVAQLR